MPEMLARTDHDFVLEERRPRRAAKKVRRLAVLRALFRNPGRTVVGAAAAAIGVAIMINALALQGGRHPAPFFRAAEPARDVPTPMPPARPAGLGSAAVPSQEAERVVHVTVPPPAPAASAPASAPAAPLPPRIQRTAAPQQPATTAVQSAPPAGIPIPPANIPNVPRDAIGDILRGSGGASVASSQGTTEIVRQEPNRSVLAAQRALNKLNYGPIKPDGLFGPGTRQAIEKFERDRKLPVTGEATGRTARELASASGIAVD